MVVGRICCCVLGTGYVQIIVSSHSLLSLCNLHWSKGPKWSHVFLINCFSAVSWQLTLTQPGQKKETSNEEEGDLCVLLFGSLVTSDKAVSFISVVYGITII